MNFHWQRKSLCLTLDENPHISWNKKWLNWNVGSFLDTWKFQLFYINVSYWAICKLNVEINIYAKLFEYSVLITHDGSNRCHVHEVLLLPTHLDMKIYKCGWCQKLKGDVKKNADRVRKKRVWLQPSKYSSFSAIFFLIPLPFPISIVYFFIINRFPCNTIDVCTVYV